MLGFPRTNRLGTQSGAVSDMPEDAKELLVLSGPWFRWTGRASKAKEGKGCSGHCFLKMGFQFEDLVNWEW